MSPTRDEDRMRIAFRVELEKPSYADAEEIRKYLLEAMAQYDQDAKVIHLGEPVKITQERLMGGQSSKV
jgi:hypothetical protein